MFCNPFIIPYKDVNDKSYINLTSYTIGSEDVKIVIEAPLKLYTKWLGKPLNIPIWLVIIFI